MRTAMKARLAAGTVGVAMLGFGAWHLLTDQDLGRKESIGKWLLGGVIVHDGILAPLVFLCCALAWRFSGVRLRRGLALFLLVGGSLTVLAVPAILRSGDNPNPTVTPLDYSRNLTFALAGLAVCVLLYALGGHLIDRRRHADNAVMPQSEPGPEPEPAENPEEVIARQSDPDENAAGPAEAEDPAPRAEPVKQSREARGPETEPVPGDDPESPALPARASAAGEATGPATPAADRETTTADEGKLDGQG